MSSEKRIAFLGLRGSGKSTFLSMLNLALALKHSPWRIRPVGESIKSMSLLNEYIFTKGLFPSATMEESSMIFLVEKEATMLGLQPGASFHFYTADIPGEAVKGLASTSARYHTFYETLKGCSGIIFLLDPEEIWLDDSTRENIDVYYSLFRSFLSEIKDQAGEDVFIAFCVTKLDVVLSLDSEFALHGVSRDIETLAERILGKNTKSWIDHNFDSDHISWFPVSSIGYVGVGNQKSSQFEIKEEGGDLKRSGIKDPRQLTPIGIAEAFEWVMNSITDYSVEPRSRGFRGKNFFKFFRNLR